MDVTCVAQETSQLDNPPWDLGWECNSEFDSWVAEGDLSTYFDGVEEIKVTDTKPTRHNDDALLVHVHESNQEESKNGKRGLRRTRTVQRSGQVVKTDNKRKANSGHLENVRKRRALEETVSEILKDAENALIQKAAVARTCSKTTEELDDAVTVGQALTREPDSKTTVLGITNKRKASAEPPCELKEGITTKKRALSRPHCERETKDSYKVPTRRNLVEPGSKITNPDCVAPRKVLDKPGCKMMTDSGDAPRLKATTGPCRAMNTVPKRAAANIPNLEEMKQKLQDSYSKTKKRRTTQLLDFKVLPKAAQGSCQRIAKRTTMNRSILKKTALF